MKLLKSKVFLLVTFLVSTYTLTAQIDFSVSAIPDSLKQHAYSVVRFDNETLTLNSLTSGILKKSYAVTVLDEKGESDAFFRFYGDVFNVMRGFSARLYDAKGKQLKKYGRSDVMTSEYSSSLASDNKIYLFKYNAPSLPYTIRYDFVVEKNNGILTLGIFNPIETYFQSVQSRIFQINLQDVSIIPRIKSCNSMAEPTVTNTKGFNSYVWKAENVKAVESEPLSPPLYDYLPYAMISMTDFSYDGVDGSISTWSDLGKWSYHLLLGRDLIPDALKAKILDLTKNAKTEREKVNILYDFMGESTRYVSIQLGIGGYRPMSAVEVYHTGFGDCKALTNFLKAMLSVIGIKSEYCTIRLDRNEKSLLPDFPNFNQMNHVILKVPLPNDTLFLECTNTKVPFGYVHSQIAGHDALVCRAEGSEMVRLPDYTDSLNLEGHVVHVKLHEDGSANVEMRKECGVKIYDQYFGFPLMKVSDQTENLRKDIHLPNIEFGNLKVTENKTALPSLILDYTWFTPMYGSKTGNRLFLPSNIYREGFDMFRTPNRLHEVSIKNGFRDADTILIEITASFEVEAMPPSILEKCRFGQFTSTVTLTGNVLKIIQVANVYNGKYKASDFPDFMAFLNKITAAYKGKIILRKKAA